MRQFSKGLSIVLALLKKVFRQGSVHYPYLIEEIDMVSRVVLLRCVGSRMVVKFKIEQFVLDVSLVDKLPAKQACVLGGCYGRILRGAVEGRAALAKVKKMQFLLGNKSGRYKIVFQNRAGDIGYLDKETQQEYVEHPLAIVSNEYVISEFDSSQACYLGMLAGICVERVGSAEELDSMLNAPSKLRIVK